MKKIITENILGYQICRLDKGTCVDVIFEWLEESDKTHYFVCANPHSIHVSSKDKVFEDALKGADLITPDGVGVLLASKILGGGITNRITGSDVFLGLNNKLNSAGGKKCFFLGSTEEVLLAIKNKMAVDYPNISVVGTYSPPFKTEFTDADNLKMINAINAVKPDVLWVGMTAPKQEKWIAHNRNNLDVNFIGAVGAVFDFYVGNVKRSHPLFLRLGLEWLPRLIQEPRRLWRRNFISNPAFLGRVMRAKYWPQKRY